MQLLLYMVLNLCYGFSLERQILIVLILDINYIWYVGK